jgi:cell division transport system permease protein
VKALNTVALCFEEAARSIWHYRRAVFPALAVMVVSLTVLGAFLLVTENVSEVLEDWRERGQLQIFLRADVSEQQRAPIEADLRSRDAVERFQYISPERAAALFRQDFSQLGEILDLLESNPLPPSYAVTVRSEMRSERVLRRMSDEIARHPGVDGVQYDLQVLGRLELGVRALRLIGLLLGGTVLLGAVTTTANVIRVLVVSRATEIDTMRLVGASEVVVVGRFLVEGAMQGMLAGLVALGILFTAFNLGVAYLDPEALGFLSTLPLSFMGTASSLALVAGGTLTGLAGSWMAFGPGGLRASV